MRPSWRSLFLGSLLAILALTGLAGCGDDGGGAGPVAPTTSEFHDKPGAQDAPARGAHGNSDN